MARAMKITAADLKRFGVVDRIVAEPSGGAHSDREAAIAAVGEAIFEELSLLDGLDPDALRRQRAERFYKIGEPGVLG
jgi:acetyl-CoA carboxylase carboxyl transferase subunit alpha